MINFVPVIQLVAGVATSFGAGSVVGNLIKHTTPEKLKTGSKILVAIGGAALSFVAGDLASRYVEDQIEEVAGMVKFATNKVKNKHQEAETPEEPETGQSYPPPGAELGDIDGDLKS